MLHNEFKIEITYKGKPHIAYLAEKPRLSGVISAIKLLLANCDYNEQDILKELERQSTKKHYE